MSECETGKCSIGENQNRGKPFKLKCSNCGLELPLIYQRKSIICPVCGVGILFWVPNNKVERG
jgi:DNA-directed RNA polymerase subunit RPC12/RpoP